MLKTFFMLFAFFWAFTEISASDTLSYLPQTPKVSNKVYTMDITNSVTRHQLTALSLQGLVNRETGQLYLRHNLSEWLFQFYLDQQIIKKEIKISNVYLLLKLFRRYYHGIVVYNPTNRYEVNLATNICGVQNRVMVTSDMVDSMKKFVDSKINTFDIATLNLTNQNDAYDWYEKNIFPHQTKKILSVAKDLLMYNLFRDYLVQFKIPTFWLPGINDADYNAEYDKRIEHLLKNTPVNIPVIGFWAGTEEGKDVGYGEFTGVKYAGNYGKYTLVNTWVGNYSYHTGVKINPGLLVQRKRNSQPFRTYNPDKKYVALIMIESGDAPAYFQYDGFFARQWNDPERGLVPISYGLTPSLQYLLPGLLNQIYKTATSNDYFFCSISGIGYCYPFEGYCSKVPGKDLALKDYFNQTAKNMHNLDMKMLGIYTHVNSVWTQDDYEIARKYILPMKGLQSIISGINKVKGYTSSTGNEIIENTTVHHTLTIWSDSDFNYSDKAKDAAAVKYLANEIRKSNDGGNFLQAMFYSWQYGPGRLNKLRELLEQEGYEFVTLDEFDYLNRVANGWKIVDHPILQKY